jgi:hypothetical protein
VCLRFPCELKVLRVAKILKDNPKRTAQQNGSPARRLRRIVYLLSLAISMLI